ncbi:polycystin family receptor for egg jelly-like [Pelodytes ibericus]
MLLAFPGCLCSVLVLGSLAQVVKPPPLEISCAGTAGKVYTRQDTDVRFTCLWRAGLLLSYSPSLSVTAQEKAGKPPVCAWHRDGAWFRNTSRWMGQEKPAVPSGSLMTVQCFTSGCPAPSCHHQNIAVSVASQDTKFFMMSPLPPVRQYQLVLFGWCAKMKSTDWQYSFSGGQGAPAVLIPSNYYVEIEDTAYPPGLHAKCSDYYNYKVNVSYSEVGQYTATLVIPNGPMAELTLYVEVEQALLHVLSASSNKLSQATDMRLGWTLLPLSDKVVAFQLTDQNSVASWTLLTNKYAVQTEFCSPPLSTVGFAFVRVHFLINQTEIKRLSGQLDFTKGIAGLTTTKNLGSVTLSLTETRSNIYYFSQASGLYYSYRDKEVEAGTSAHFIFYEEESLSILFHITYVGSHLFSLTAHAYLNKKNVLYQSLSDVDVEVHFFNSGSSLLFTLIYIVWFIPLQHPLLQCEWVFILELYGSKKSYLFRNTTYTYRDYVTNAAAFIPQSKLEFDTKFYAGFVAKVNFTKSGLKPVVLKTKIGSYASKVLETSIYCFKVPCDILEFRIKKPKSPPVIRTTKGSHLSIFVSIQLNCFASQAVGLLWRIYRVSKESTIPDWDNYLDLPQVSIVNQSNIEIPRFALNYGFYGFNVSIDIATADDEDSSLSKSDYAVVAVQASDLMAVISGGSFRTVGFGESWTLNGSTSSDPDSPDPLQGLSFTWYCTKNASDYLLMNISKNTTCHPEQTSFTWINPHAITQTVEAQSLQGNRTYYFRLVVSKRNKTGYFDQTVFVAPGVPPAITVICIENCLRILIPTERFALSGKCVDCSKTSRPEYEWSLYQASNEIAFDWASKTTTGRSIAYLSIIAKSFLNIADKWYTIVLKVTTWTGAPSTYKYTFYVNSPPKAGICHIDPSIGITLQTKFVVRCSGFSDQNLPIIYKIIAALDKKSHISSLRENSLGSVVYYGYDPAMPPSSLPIGAPSQSYSLKLYVQVQDSLSSYTQLGLSAIVKDLNQGQPEETIFDELNSLTNGSSSPINIFLETGDFIKAGHLIYMVASVLNNFISINPEYPLKEERIKFRERLLNLSCSIMITHILGVNQIITSISELTQDTKEINIKSQQLAAGKLTEVASYLLKYRKEILGSVESEILSSGILASLSNVMSASLLNITNLTNDIPSDTVDVLQNILSVAETVTDIVLQGKVPGEIDTLMETQHFKIRLKKEERWDIVNSYLKTLDCVNCFYPALQNDTSVVAIDAVVVSAFSEFNLDPLPWLKNRRGIDTMVTGYYMAAIKDSDQVIYIIPEKIDVIMQRKTKIHVFDISISPDVEKTTSGLFSFEVNIYSKAEWFVQFYYTHVITFNISVHIGENITNNPPIALFNISNVGTVQSKTHRNFLRSWNPKTIRIPTESIPKTSPAVNLSVELTTNYIVWRKKALLKISIFNVACVDFEEGDDWNDANCKAGPLTDNKRVHCVCEGFRKYQTRSAKFLKHKHTFFAAKVFVSPNPIDRTKATFRELGKNLVTLFTVLAILTVYAVLAFWTHRWDKRDMISKQKVIVLPDNDPYDTECLFVTLYTGSRFGAGTTADVFLKIVGKESDSDVHLLKCPGHHVFVAGGLDTFLVTTRSNLGEICYIRIWHNNYGDSPGWYLSRIKIENLYTKQVWYFMCRKWLDIDKDDGQIDRCFFPTDTSNPLANIDFFLIHLSWKIYEEHLWLSIFAPVLPNVFNRVQRLSCCLVILMSSLMVNIAFFNAENYPDEEAPTDFLRPIVVGVESSLITFPVELLVRSLFNCPPATTHSTEQESSTTFNSRYTTTHTLYSRSKTQLTGWRERLEEFYRQLGTVNEDIAVETNSTYSGLDSLPSSLLKFPKSSKLPSVQIKNCTMPEVLVNEIVTIESLDPKSEINISRKYSSQKIKLNIKRILIRKGPCIVFYRWSHYIAWSLVLIVSVVSACLIILYGLTYGYVTSMLWLLAVATSFIQSVFITQVAKIILKSAFSALSAKYYRDIPWTKRWGFLEIDLDRVHVRADDKRDLHCKLTALRDGKRYHPLKYDEIVLYQRINMVKAKSSDFIKHIVSHFIFLSLVLNLAYSSDNINVFRQNKAIYHQFSLNLENKERLFHIYSWISEVFLPLIHNHERPTFVVNTWAKIIGLPRIRQVKATRCYHTASIMHRLLSGRNTCTQNNGFPQEEKTVTMGKKYNPNEYDGFTFEDSIPHWNYSLLGAEYGLGGYTVYFFPEKDLADSFLV